MPFRVGTGSRPETAYLTSLAAGSRRVQAAALTWIARLLTSDPAATFRSVRWEAVRYEHAQAIRSKAVETFKPATARRYLSALRGVLGASYSLGLISAEDYQRAVKLEKVRGKSVRAGRSLSAEEQRLLFEGCAANRPLDVRDRAILAVMLGCGLRRSEIVGLDLSDLGRDADGRFLLVRKGKGNKDRQAAMPADTGSALDEWVALRGPEAGPLFRPVFARGRSNPSSRLTADSVYWMALARARRAGIARWTPHDTRRTYVSSLLDSGIDLARVSHMAGHESTATTALYDRRSMRSEHAAAATIRLPIRREEVETEPAGRG